MPGFPMELSLLTSAGLLAGRLAEFHIPEPDLAAMVLEQEGPLTLLPKPAVFLNLLAATAALTTSLPHSYSSTFSPLSQCSTWLPLTRIREELISPGGLTRRGRRRQHVIERSGELLAVPFSTPGARSSSSIWYSCPSGCSRESSMKYLTPLLPAGASFQSHCSSKSLNSPSEYDIAAALAQAVQPAVLDHPAFLGKRLLLEGVPALRGVAVEEQPPPSRLLLFSKLVGRGR